MEENQKIVYPNTVYDALTKIKDAEIKQRAFYNCKQNLKQELPPYGDNTKALIETAIQMSFDPVKSREGAQAWFNFCGDIEMTYETFCKYFEGEPPHRRFTPRANGEFETLPTQHEITIDQHIARLEYHAQYDKSELGEGIRALIDAYRSIHVSKLGPTPTEITRSAFIDTVARNLYIKKTNIRGELCNPSWCYQQANELWIARQAFWANIKVS